MDDVEILEVIGVEEDDVAPVVSGAPPDEPDDEPGEVLLGFDEDPHEPDLGAAPEPPNQAEDVPEPEPDPPPEPADSASADSDILLRLRADYDNLRKRIDREREEFELYANAALVSRLLPVLDNLERAMAVDPQTGGEDDSLRQGLIMIHRQLTDELRREGLEAIDSVGKPFDPVLHDAVATDPTSEAPPNTVIEEFQRGYRFQDRVLRHAMVRVSTNGAAMGSDDSEGMR